MLLVGAGFPLNPRPRPIPRKVGGFPVFHLTVDIIGHMFVLGVSIKADPAGRSFKSRKTLTRGPSQGSIPDTRCVGNSIPSEEGKIAYWPDWVWSGGQPYRRASAANVTHVVLGVLPVLENERTLPWNRWKVKRSPPILAELSFLKTSNSRTGRNKPF